MNLLRGEALKRGVICVLLFELVAMPFFTFRPNIVRAQEKITIPSPSSQDVESQTTKKVVPGTVANTQKDAKAHGNHIDIEVKGTDIDNLPVNWTTWYDLGDRSYQFYVLRVGDKGKIEHWWYHKSYIAPNGTLNLEAHDSGATGGFVTNAYDYHVYLFIKDKNNSDKQGLVKVAQVEYRPSSLDRRDIQLALTFNEAAKVTKDPKTSDGKVNIKDFLVRLTGDELGKYARDSYITFCYMRIDHYLTADPVGDGKTVKQLKKVGSYGIELGDRIYNHTDMNDGCDYLLTKTGDGNEPQPLIYKPPTDKPIALKGDCTNPDATKRTCDTFVVDIGAQIFDGIKPRVSQNNILTLWDNSFLRQYISSPITVGYNRETGKIESVAKISQPKTPVGTQPDQAGSPDGCPLGNIGPFGSFRNPMCYVIDTIVAGSATFAYFAIVQMFIPALSLN